MSAVNCTKWSATSNHGANEKFWVTTRADHHITYAVKKLKFGPNGTLTIKELRIKYI